MLMSHKSFCVFSAGNFFFGVDVDRVQEAILHDQAITPVPLAHESIEGLMNLRGRIVTVIDLRNRLGLSARNEGAKSMHVIIRSEGSGLISLLVDELEDAMDLDDAIFESPPETLTGKIRELVRGAYKLEGRLLFVLNVDEAINLAQAA